MLWLLVILASTVVLHTNKPQGRGPIYPIVLDRQQSHDTGSVFARSSEIFGRAQGDFNKMAINIGRNVFVCHISPLFLLSV